MSLLRTVRYAFAAVAVALAAGAHATLPDHVFKDWKNDTELLDDPNFCLIAGEFAKQYAVSRDAGVSFDSVTSNLKTGVLPQRYPIVADLLLGLATTAYKFPSASPETAHVQFLAACLDARRGKK